MACICVVKCFSDIELPQKAQEGSLDTERAMNCDGSSNLEVFPPETPMSNPSLFVCSTLGQESGCTRD